MIMTEQRMLAQYKIVEFLGSGAMGTVHVAVDTYMDRPVAIKSLRPDLTQDPEFVSRFRAEAKSLARLNHPNILVFESGAMDDAHLVSVREPVSGLRDNGERFLDAEGFAASLGSKAACA